MSISKERKDRYYKYLRSKQWADIKLDLIQTRGAQCERCGSKRKQFRYLHVHHLTYKNLFNEEPEDLEILCAPCHRAEHSIGKKRKRDKKTVKTNIKGIPRNQKKKLTLVDSLRNKKGGFDKPTIKALGYKWPPQKGWKAELESREDLHILVKRVKKLMLNRPIVERPNKKKNKPSKRKLIDERWKKMREKFGFGNI